LFNYGLLSYKNDWFEAAVVVVAAAAVDVVVAVAVVAVL
jgi:hypothetical protein